MPQWLRRHILLEKKPSQVSDLSFWRACHSGAPNRIIWREEVLPSPSHLTVGPFLIIIFYLFGLRSQCHIWTKQSHLETLTHTFFSFPVVWSALWPGMPWAAKRAPPPRWSKRLPFTWCLWVARLLRLTFSSRASSWRVILALLHASETHPSSIFHPLEQGVLSVNLLCGFIKASQ